MKLRQVAKASIGRAVWRSTSRPIRDELVARVGADPTLVRTLEDSDQTQDEPRPAPITSPPRSLASYLVWPLAASHSAFCHSLYQVTEN
jgi:hypothetical protein